MNAGISIANNQPTSYSKMVSFFCIDFFHLLSFTLVKYKILIVKETNPRPPVRTSRLQNRTVSLSASITPPASQNGIAVLPTSRDSSLFGRQNQIFPHIRPQCVRYFFFGCYTNI